MAKEPTVKQLDDAYGASEGYDPELSKAEKLQFANDYDGGQALRDQEAEKASAGGSHHLLRDSIHYTDEDGAWHEHLHANGPVTLPASEFDRLAEIGAVTKDEAAHDEFWARREALAAGTPPGAVSF